MAWASSYAGQLAGKTVSAKLLAMKKEHERLNLLWHGGHLLHNLLKGIKQSDPQVHFA